MIRASAVVCLSLTLAAGVAPAVFAAGEPPPALVRVHVHIDHTRAFDLADGGQWLAGPVGELVRGIAQLMTEVEAFRARALERDAEQDVVWELEVSGPRDRFKSVRLYDGNAGAAARDVTLEEAEAAVRRTSHARPGAWVYRNRRNPQLFLEELAERAERAEVDPAATSHTFVVLLTAGDDGGPYVARHPVYGNYAAAGLHAVESALRHQQMTFLATNPLDRDEDSVSPFWLASGWDEILDLEPAPTLQTVRLRDLLPELRRLLALDMLRSSGQSWTQCDEVPAGAVRVDVLTHRGALPGQHPAGRVGDLGFYQGLDPLAGHDGLEPLGPSAARCRWFLADGARLALAWPEAGPLAGDELRVSIAAPGSLRPAPGDAHIVVEIDGEPMLHDCELRRVIANGGCNLPPLGDDGSRIEARLANHGAWDVAPFSTDIRRRRPVEVSLVHAEEVPCDAGARLTSSGPFLFTAPPQQACIRYSVAWSPPVAESERRVLAAGLELRVVGDGRVIDSAGLDTRLADAHVEVRLPVAERGGARTWEVQLARREQAGRLELDRRFEPSIRQEVALWLGPVDDWRSVSLPSSALVLLCVVLVAVVIRRRPQALKLEFVVPARGGDEPLEVLEVTTRHGRPVEVQPNELPRTLGLERLSVTQTRNAYRLTLTPCAALAEEPGYGPEVELPRRNHSARPWGPFQVRWVRSDSAGADDGA